MLNEKNERELAYVVEVNDVYDMEGVNNQIAVVGGWTVFVKRDEFKKGDLAVYFEIDSKLPPLDIFEFMKKYNYHVKTQKFVQGKVISQGLLVSPKQLGIVSCKQGDFLTEKLGVTYYEVEDNKRKANIQYVAKSKVTKYMMRFSLVRKLMSKKSKVFPEWVKKTDEERCQNLRGLFPGNGDEWIATEKIDGTSGTFTMKRHRKLIVCSRNINVTGENNAYTQIASKYNIGTVLKMLLKKYPKTKFVTIQGEIYGKNIQKRDYSKEDIDFAAFNLIINGERLDTITMKKVLEEYGIPSVPIIDEHFVLPKTCDEMVKIADGVSIIDGKIREGLVVRQGGNRSFKAVSNKYLIIKGE